MKKIIGTLALLTAFTGFLYGGPEDILKLSWELLQDDVAKLPKVEKFKNDDIITYRVKNIKNTKSEPTYITFTIELVQKGKVRLKRIILVGHEGLDGKGITESYEVTSGDEKLFGLVKNLYLRLLYLYRVQPSPEGGKIGPIDMVGLHGIWATK